MAGYSIGYAVPAWQKGGEILPQLPVLETGIAAVGVLHGNGNHARRRVELVEIEAKVVSFFELLLVHGAETDRLRFG